MTVQRVPRRFATCPIRMPPPPAQSHAAALAAAGTARAPPTSAAMSLSATVLIHTPPNAIVSTASAVTAMRHDCADSTELVGKGGISDSDDSVIAAGALCSNAGITTLNCGFGRDPTRLHNRTLWRMM